MPVADGGGRQEEKTVTIESGYTIFLGRSMRLDVDDREREQAGEEGEVRREHPVSPNRAAVPANNAAHRTSTNG